MKNAFGNSFHADNPQLFKMKNLEYFGNSLLGDNCT